MLELHESIFAYEDFVNERNNLQAVVDDQKKILDTWTKASGISHDLIKDHIPFQTNCILEGKLKTAALTTEIFEMEKDIKDLNPPNYQTLAHNYSKQEEKENLTYLPVSVVVDDGAYDYSKDKPRVSSSGVSI